ncbi:hypothetical protein SAY87_028749 [Trapa incisa]|uniref:Uncharacterized protein n=1 Tax=Trapa incisa TaxID=236973 RepID=A0AAN7KVG3_9MYRT|nr:hypothetical protein SAY87_028749 [Trapa incisa]
MRKLRILQCLRDTDPRCLFFAMTVTKHARPHFISLDLSAVSAGPTTLAGFLVDMVVNVSASSAGEHQILISEVNTMRLKHCDEPKRDLTDLYPQHCICIQSSSLLPTLSNPNT